MARQKTLRDGEDAARAVDERSPLLSNARRESSSSVVGNGCVDVEREAHAATVDTSPSGRGIPTAAVVKIVAILLIGTFTANADGSLVMATHPTIASEFDDLENSSWLFVAFALAGAATQTLVGVAPRFWNLGKLTWKQYGKLSDIYGRRALLMVAYLLFSIGCALVGVGRTMWQVVVGRVISGSGGSALNVLGLLLITDLVPLRDVAAWQAGVNLAATLGRSLGAPVGGWLADTIGWRWSFLGQAPIFLVAVLLCWFFLPEGKPGEKEDAAEETGTKPGEAKTSPLAKVDFLGAALLALFLLAFLLPIEIGGTKVPWTHPLIFVLFGAAAVLGGLFGAVEEWWAKEPIFPLELLKHRDIVLTYVITGAQVAAQLGLMFSVPLYFQVTQRVSNTIAGLHLFPAVAGNAIGGVLAGYLIRRTGRYKSLLIVATIASSFSYFLLLLRWHGDTNAWESLYIVPGGFGAGLVQSAGIISVQAAVNPKHKAAVTSGIFLTFQIGMILGLASVSAVMMETMRWRLDALLKGMDLGAMARKTIIEKATSSVDFIDHADSGIANAIVQSYVEGLGFSHGVSLISSVLGLIAAIFLREHKLQ
ncbi:Major facilitator superfamily transporter [Colletotrichum higginsianum IMI 349063]|uniref:Major facilitator superfamily transporter n=1 Tax=Colletotrichum higginsianum (strain IMI 349063) TaxID=759273 RepID=A0A1B7XR67_COLHI|nr:Major facilitator superfamily transporter [Colletotrichum higginsianum IMI 349063]OBR02258.1 Major facilitator superfamily transporter [Colletotrichum higginsianum IMI 349063]